MPISGAGNGAVLTHGRDLRIIAAPGDVGGRPEHVPLVIGVVRAQRVPLIQPDPNAGLGEPHRARDHADIPGDFETGTRAAHSELCLANRPARESSGLRVEGGYGRICDAPAQRSLGDQDVFRRERLCVEFRGSSEGDLDLGRPWRSHREFRDSLMDRHLDILALQQT